jgi:uncharacterized protein
MSNVQTIRDIYAAYSRGDLPAILGRLSATVEWEYPGTSTTVPWLQRRVGREAAAGFFEALGGMQIEKFAPKEFLEAEGVVVVLLDVAFTVTATGQRVDEEDEIHVWRFDSQGKVSRFKHGVDSHRHQLATEARRP